MYVFGLFTFFNGKKVIVITHGFKKKDDAIDPSEIKTANDYRQDYILRKKRIK